jgi:hypothetical protein
VPSGFLVFAVMLYFECDCIRDLLVFLLLTSGTAGFFSLDFDLDLDLDYVGEFFLNLGVDYLFVDFSFEFELFLGFSLNYFLGDFDINGLI